MVSSHKFLHPVVEPDGKKWGGYTSHPAMLPSNLEQSIIIIDPTKTQLHQSAIKWCQVDPAYSHSNSGKGNLKKNSPKSMLTKK
jgi:hypothetical protein